MRGVHGRLRSGAKRNKCPWGTRARWAHLLAEKNFSDAHVAGRMIQLIRVCGRELCEAFEPWLTMMLVKI